MIQQFVSNPKKYSLNTTIAHVVNRYLDITSYGDASLEAGGCFSNDLFWLHTEWILAIKSLPLKNITVTRRCKVANKLDSINLLEFAVEIIKYAALSILLTHKERNLAHEFPILLNWTDNKTTQAYIRKSAVRTDKGQALQHMLCSLMINNPLEIKADCIEGKSNILAESISRIFVSSNTFFDDLFLKFTQIRSWKRFHPSQELLS